MRSALMRPSQVSVPGAPSIAWAVSSSGLAGAESVMSGRPVSQRLTMSARLVRQPRAPTLSSPAAKASSRAAAQAS
jgi:hypothetical protein